MNEFKDQLDAAEKEKVSTLIAELREGISTQIYPILKLAC